LPTSAGGPTSDFNGDGTSDILWQNTNGQPATWLLNNTTPFNESVASGNPGPSWQVVGAGDFNGEGDADILWQNTNGQAAVWLMNGTTPFSEMAVGANPGPGSSSAAAISTTMATPTCCGRPPIARPRSGW